VVCHHFVALILSVLWLVRCCGRLFFSNMAQAAAGAGLEQLARAQNVMAAVNHCQNRSTPGDGDCLLNSLLEEFLRLEATGLHIPPAFPKTTPTLRQALIEIIRNGPAEF